MSIDPEKLHDQVKRLCPKRFKGSYAEVMTSLITHTAALIDENHRLTRAHANQLVRATRQALPDGRKRRAFKLVIEVLEAINLTGAATCAMPGQTHHPMRPQTTADSALQFHQQAIAYAMDQYLDRWIAERAAGEPMDRVLAFALRLTTRTGMGADLVSGSLARLTPARVTANGALHLPIDIANFSRAYYHWPLPPGCARLLPPGSPKDTRDDGLLFAEALGEPIDSTLPEDALIDAAAQKQKAVADALQKAFQAFAQAFRRDTGHRGGVPLKSWTTFCLVGRFIPQGRGMPPALIELGKGFPLPACTDLHALAAQAPRQSVRLSGGTLASAPIKPPTADTTNLTAPAGGEWFDTEALPEDWAAKANRILQRFCQDAEALQGKNHYVTEANHQKLEDQRDKRLGELNALWAGPTLAHIGLGWLCELALKRAKISTLRTYVSRLLAVSTLALEPAMNLPLWDDDIVYGMETQIIASRDWQHTTVGHFRQTWGDCLRYAKRIGHLPEVEHLPGGQAHVHTAKRIHILTPYEAGLIWNHCLHHGGEWGAQAAAAVMLGFYGGLRSADVLGLTLKDVDIDHGEVRVTISGGKTPAATRSIPLDVLAPPEMVRWFREFVEARRQQFADPRCTGWKINQIALFGPRDNADRYTREALINPIIGLMREHLGSEVDFHLLRHSFVSWLILRVHAMRHPGFAETLPQKAATMFQPEALAQLRQLFDGEAHPRAGTDDHILMKDMVGHEDLRTSILHYTHTLDWIHADVMRRAYNEGPRVKVA
ncbi:site-specific integrase [Spiribacter onubensis]|uniref:Site-specific integrase n=1 Tax=Spiribacter onubensis TaxID=3122420 RepID=A0ABV3SB94_9GAMM